MSDNPKPPPQLPHHRAGPTDFTDPLLIEEARKALVWLSIAGLFALVVLLAQPLLVVFGGLVLAAMIDGGARLLQRILPITRIWRVTIVLLFIVLFLVWILLFAGSQIADQAAALPETIRASSLKWLSWAQHRGLRLDSKMQASITEQLVGGVGQISHVVGGLIGGFTEILLILVLGIYFAIDPDPYSRGLAWMLPRDARDDFAGTLRKMGHALRRLMAGRLLAMGLEGFTTWVALSLYGVPMAALLGLITALLAFLPNIGAPISGLIMVLVGFSGGMNMGLFCIGLYFVMHTIDGNIIGPMVAKKAVDLAPALVMAMQLMMGVLFGILGLALADPLLAMLKVLLERQSTRSERRAIEGAEAA
ncbi:MAG: hypothetical protein RLY97_1710 [Pseudomonadota bacterium]|jgi:predicted PurR-regulated permease PerM